MNLLPFVKKKGHIEQEFNPSLISISLIKETGLTPQDAKSIMELTTRRIVNSNIKFLSGPHIREIVCSILAEHHFERERKLYTRIGIPRSDLKKILDSKSPRINDMIAEKVITEYYALNEYIEGDGK